MVRFFADPDSINNAKIILSQEDSDHVRSLRLRPNELFIVCDGNSTDYVCSLQDRETSQLAVPDGICVAQILSRKKTRTEPHINCVTYIAYTKGDRLEYAVQKSVELGAYKIALFHCERCIVAPSDIAKKAERLQKISLEAAKQSGRGIIPEVVDIGEFNNAIDIAVENEDTAILCYEDEKSMHLMTVLNHYFPAVNTAFREPINKTQSIAIITGPEGGFEPSEVRYAQSKNVSVVTLGHRILRAETAPVAVLSAIMYHTENF